MGNLQGAMTLNKHDNIQQNNTQYNNKKMQHSA